MRKLLIVPALAGLAFSMAACGSDSDNNAGGTTGGATTSASAPMTTSSAMPSSSSSGSMTQPFGAACSKIPASGAGSADAMSVQPVGTAASTNPVLTTLTAAVKAAGLVDSLNSAQALTVFAPADSAFAKIPAADLQKLLADPKGDLTKILTYHVIPERLAPDQLAGTHKTLNGGEVTVEGSGESFTVGTGKSNVVCGNVQTANATVYIIDTVLSPPAS